MTDILFQNYTEQAKSLKGCVPALNNHRDKAITAFCEIGLPGKKDEAWRYSDLSHLRKSVYGLPNASDCNAPTLTSDEPCHEYAAKLVFVNGHLDEGQSILLESGQNIHLAQLSASITTAEDFSNNHTEYEDGVSLLNTALAQDGFVLNIPARVSIDKPILVHHITNNADKAAVYTRHKVSLGEGAKASIIEYFSGDQKDYWLNTLLDIHLSPSASLTHLRLLEDGEQATQTGKIFADIDTNGTYSSFSLALGGKMLRSESHIRILGENAHANLDGIALSAPGQSHDILTTVKHCVPEATSDQMFRSVLSEKSQISFQGKVVVQKDAQLTQADQACNSILLDRTAQSNAKPELEIWADDVKCSHGATVGELDDVALFYLVARGIAPETAKAMLIEAFLSEVIDRNSSEFFQKIARDRIQIWLEKYLPTLRREAK